MRISVYLCVGGSQDCTDATLDYVFISSLLFLDAFLSCLVRLPVIFLLCFTCVSFHLITNLFFPTIFFVFLILARSPSWFVCLFGPTPHFHACLPSKLWVWSNNHHQSAAASNLFSHVCGINQQPYPSESGFLLLLTLKIIKCRWQIPSNTPPIWQETNQIAFKRQVMVLMPLFSREEVWPYHLCFGV